MLYCIIDCIVNRMEQLVKSNVKLGEFKINEE